MFQWGGFRALKCSKVIFMALKCSNRVGFRVQNAPILRRELYAPLRRHDNKHCENGLLFICLLMIVTKRWLGGWLEEFKLRLTHFNWQLKIILELASNAAGLKYYRLYENLSTLNTTQLSEELFVSRWPTTLFF